MSYISSALVDRVSGGVSRTTMQEIAAFHATIRALLTGYETFLQGSYANDTAIADINDVDIDAVRQITPGGTHDARILFPDVLQKLETHQVYRGKVQMHRKCLTVALQTRQADIVPALRDASVSRNPHDEPIFIANSIPNYPKTHIYNGSQKNIQTNQNYKKTVRMLKNYIVNWNVKDLAPSFYAECMIYSYDNGFFSNDLPLSLYLMLERLVSTNFNTQIRTVAGDKIIVTASEWHPVSFQAFRTHVSTHLSDLRSALTAAIATDANYYFRRFFNL